MKNRSFLFHVSFLVLACLSFWGCNVGTVPGPEELTEKEIAKKQTLETKSGHEELLEKGVPQLQLLKGSKKNTLISRTLQIKVPLTFTEIQRATSSFKSTFLFSCNPSEANQQQTKVLIGQMAVLHSSVQEKKLTLDEYITVLGATKPYINQLKNCVTLKKVYLPIVVSTNITVDLAKKVDALFARHILLGKHIWLKELRWKEGKHIWRVPQQSFTYASIQEH